MYVHLKQSGEELIHRDRRREPGISWDLDQVYRSAERIREVHANAGKLGVEGVMIVSGAGNVARGDKIKEAVLDLRGEDSKVAQVADTVGRWATAQNAALLGAALQDLRTPYKLFAAPNMGFVDPVLGIVEPYYPEAVKEAYKQERVALMLGESGKGNQTTDAAVMDYTVWHGAEFPDDQSVAFKATRFSGIYTADPAKDPNAQQFAMISAQTMLDEGLRGVDEQCLRVIAGAKGDVELYVYSGECSPLEALQREAAGCAGTIITSAEVEPIFLSAA